MARWGLFAAALVASLLVTGLLWWLGVPGFFLFLFLPLLGLPLARRTRPPLQRRCPACGRPADSDARFCPRDGTPLP